MPAPLACPQVDGSVKARQSCFSPTHQAGVDMSSFAHCFALRCFVKRFTSCVQNSRYESKCAFHSSEGAPLRVCPSYCGYYYSNLAMARKARGVGASSKRCHRHLLHVSLGQGAETTVGY
eukprot:6206267-Amphidinium_carterae.1